MIIQQATFVKSSPEYKQCPTPDLPEFAFIGRSNVGKSSLINLLTNRKNLAKTSGTPGKTQLINHFLINDQWYLVDLPGYGFAKVSKSIRGTWEKLIKDYLRHRENLMNTFILIDARHNPIESDMEFIRWFGENTLPFVLVFTKADKLPKTKLSQNLNTYQKALQAEWEELPLSLVTSAKSGRGKEQVLGLIKEFLL